MTITICNFPDLDVYLLYYLDIKTIFQLMLISKNQYNLLSKQDFIQQLCLLKRKNIKIFEIIEYACKYNYLELIKWIDASVNEFLYDPWAINAAALLSNISILDWFKNSNHIFIYTKTTILSLFSDGNIEVLKWFRDSGYDLLYNEEELILIAATFGNSYISEWLKICK